MKDMITLQHRTRTSLYVPAQAIGSPETGFSNRNSVLETIENCVGRLDIDLSGVQKTVFERRERKNPEKCKMHL